jgi:hypothetical protein
MEELRVAQSGHQQPGDTIRGALHAGSTETLGSKVEHLNGVPSPDRRTDRMSQPEHQTIPPGFYQLLAR